MIVMSNPFVIKWRLICDGCDVMLPKGAKAFYHTYYKYCPNCALKRNLVCFCGAYKKPEGVMCSQCDFAAREDVIKDFS